MTAVQRKYVFLSSLPSRKDSASLQALQLSVEHCSSTSSLLASTIGQLTALQDVIVHVRSLRTQWSNMSADRAMELQVVRALTTLPRLRTLFVGNAKQRTANLLMRWNAVVKHITIEYSTLSSPLPSEPADHLDPSHVDLMPPIEQDSEGTEPTDHVESEFEVNRAWSTGSA